jgi:hypothetical protein
MQLITSRQVDVELWLCGPVNVDWPARLLEPRQLIRRDEQRARTLATLRELERFERNQTAPFHYVPARHIQTQFYQMSTAAVIQTLYLFSPLDERTTLDDHLATMADALLAALHIPVQQQIAQHMSRTAVKANAMINHDGRGMVSSLGAYSVRFPRGWLDEALIWRAVLDILFEERIGLHPVLSLTSSGDYVEFDPDDVPDDAVARRQSAEAFVSRFRDYYDNDDIVYALARQTTERLNGEGGGLPALNRVGALGRTRRWLQLVRNLIAQQTAAGRVISLINDLDRQLREWQEFLEREMRPAVELRYQAARQQLTQLSQQTGRKWSLTNALEWPAYKERIRNWLAAEPAGGGADPLVRGAQRVGWFIKYDEVGPRLTVQLWAPRGDFVWTDEADVDPPAFLLPREADLTARRLYRLFAPLAAVRSTRTQILELAGSVSAQDWLERASPRLAIDSTKAGKDMGVAGGVGERVILVAPKSAEAVDLRDNLRNAPTKPTVELCETDDFSSITVMRVRDRVPLATCTGLYDDAAWVETFVPPGLYVRRGEQRAAEIESGARLGAAFVGWLEEDPALVDLYAHAFLFGLFSRPDDNELELPGIGVWPGHTPGDGLANLFSADESRRPPNLVDPHRREEARQELARAIHDRQADYWREPGRREYLRFASQELLPDLFRSRDLHDKNLAIYLQGIIRKL